MKQRIAALAVAALTSGALGLAGLALAEGTAHADNGCDVPYGCWCPGKSLPRTSGPIDWDMSVCHNYHYSPMGGHGDFLPEPAGYCWNPFSDNFPGDRC
jgi:hypothetical protein